MDKEKVCRGSRGVMVEVFVKACGIGIIGRGNEGAERAAVPGMDVSVRAYG